MYVKIVSSFFHIKSIFSFSPNLLSSLLLLLLLSFLLLFFIVIDYVYCIAD